MVKLTKLNGDTIIVNERWIETIEELPDTTITVSTGNKFLVLESSKVIMEKIIQWRSNKGKVDQSVKKKKTIKK